MIATIETQQFKMMMDAIRDKDESIKERQRLTENNKLLNKILNKWVDCYFADFHPTDDLLKETQKAINSTK